MEAINKSIRKCGGLLPKLLYKLTNSAERKAPHCRSGSVYLTALEDSERQFRTADFGEATNTAGAAFKVEILDFLGRAEGLAMRRENGSPGLGVFA